MQEHHTDIDHHHDHDDYDHGHDEHEHGEHSHDHDEHEHDHDLEEHEGHGEHGHGGHGHEHGRVDADLYGNQAGLRAVQISTAGIFIVLVIIASAVAGAVESILKLTSGAPPTQLPLSMAAALVGVAGNELLAQYKISVGKRINSVPLIADGQHSRIDGLTSLAAFIGLIGVALGFPLADPIAGLVITAVILTVVYSTTRSVLQRLLDAVDPRLIPSILTIASKVPGVEAVTEPRARWIGHTLHVSLNIEVDPELKLADAHAIAEEVRHRLVHEVKGLSEAIIHTDPSSHGGDFHQLMAHHQQEAQRPLIER